jgi:hypothetical protein
VKNGIVSYWSMLLLAGLAGFSGCTKEAHPPVRKNDAAKARVRFVIRKPPATPQLSEFRQYTIAAGAHYCVPNPFTQVSLTELRFQVYFDSSCRYTTVDPKNQIDINKLYGFSDNNSFHQLFSARIGWRWLNEKLELVAYVYNNGSWTFSPITTVAVGAVHQCTIRVVGGNYAFMVNNAAPVIMPRASKAAVAQGYMLYPYFGGDEVAPHQVRIFIKLL